MKRFQMIWDPFGKHFTFPVKRRFSVRLNSSFREIESYVNSIKGTSLNEKDHQFKAGYLRLRSDINQVNELVMEETCRAVGKDYQSMIRVCNSQVQCYF